MLPESICTDFYFKQRKNNLHTTTQGGISKVIYYALNTGKAILLQFQACMF